VEQLRYVHIQYLLLTEQLFIYTVQFNARRAEVRSTNLALDATYRTLRIRQTHGLFHTVKEQ
jgi:hypothetical protein